MGIIVNPVSNVRRPKPAKGRDRRLVEDEEQRLMEACESHSLYDSKKEVRIYDYVDDQVEMLQRMYAKRKSGYCAMGYLISDNGASESDMFE